MTGGGGRDVDRGQVGRPGCGGNGPGHTRGMGTLPSPGTFGDGPSPGRGGVQRLRTVTRDGWTDGGEPYGLGTDPWSP